MLETHNGTRPIFVVGIDRSGTSLLGEVLYRWGAHAGDPEFLGDADAGNPRGYWEYKPMQEFVSELLAATGCSIWDPACKGVTRQLAANADFRRRAEELAATMGSSGRPWFWKEPDLLFTLPFWREIFADAVYLITLRNPYDSAVSYEKFFLPPILRDNVRLIAYFFLRWQYSMVSIAEELKDHGSKLLVAYEDLVSHPREQCDRICRFLAAEYGLSAGCAPDRTDQMVEAISPALWRNQGRIPFSEAPLATAVQNELYEYLSRRLDGDLGDFDAARYPFPECSQEYLANIGFFQWLFKNL
jgi:hypothetical protein